MPALGLVGGLVDRSGVGAILLAVAAAGMLAGLVAGVFHYVATEPVIERAIVLEDSMHHDATDEAPVVTRDVQRKGGIVGWVLYGLFVGLIFGAVYALARPQVNGAGLVLNAILVALAACWLVGLFPFLKYPANPPGVGDPDTIGYRQALFVLFWVLSVGGVLMAGWADRLLRPRLSGMQRYVAVAALYAIYAVVLFIAMPPNPDPVEMPADLVNTFRLLSAAGLALFWLVLGASFGVFIRGLQRSPARLPA